MSELDAENQAGQKDNNQDPVKKFGRTIELTFIGLLEFIARVFHTAWSIIVNPSNVIAGLEASKSSSNYARPYTFLVLSCVLGSIALAHDDFTSAMFGHSIIESIESTLEITSPLDLLHRTFPMVVAIIAGCLLFSSFIDKK